jgi:quercetin dioxygenase-like cupin family protein
MEWVSGNIFIRPNKLETAGAKIDGHKHNFDHTTIVFTGRVHVRATLENGTVREGDFAAGSHFLVRANVEHEITALDDNTVFWCVYSHRDPQGRVSQVYEGWEAAYV